MYEGRLFYEQLRISGYSPGRSISFSGALENLRKVASSLSMFVRLSVTTEQGGPSRTDLSEILY
jgi:hypothetical protein